MPIYFKKLICLLIIMAMVIFTTPSIAYSRTDGTNAVRVAGVNYTKQRIPVGTVVAVATQLNTTDRARSDYVSGWALCDGSEVDTKAYPRLAEVLGTMYDPDGEKCVLPNYQGKFLRGFGGQSNDLGKAQMEQIVEPLSINSGTGAIEFTAVINPDPSSHALQSRQDFWNWWDKSYGKNDEKIQKFQSKYYGKSWSESASKHSQIDVNEATEATGMMIQGIGRVKSNVDVGQNWEDNKTGHSGWETFKGLLGGSGGGLLGGAAVAGTLAATLALSAATTAGIGAVFVLAGALLGALLNGTEQTRFGTLTHYSIPSPFEGGASSATVGSEVRPVNMGVFYYIRTK